jgi:nitrate reductase gamma subunit
MNKVKIFLSSILLLGFSILLKAQEVESTTNSISKEERTQQSIYIVMAVVITIVIGLFLYLVNIDRKVSKLEKERR